MFRPIVNRTPGTIPYTAVGKVLAEALERRIDILAIGDSNQAFGGIGWDHGMQFALSKKYGLYATGILTTGENGGAGQALGYYAAGGDRDAAAVETGAPTILDDYMDGNLFPQNYSYLAAGSFVQGYGLFLIAPGDEDPFDVLNSDFKIHYCYGTFDTGVGSFTPGIRLEVSPWTNYVTGSPVSTNTGVQGIAYTSLNSGVGPRPNQIACRFGHVGTTVTAPYISYFWRAEIEARTTGISYSSIFSEGGQSMYDMAAAFIAASDNSVWLQLYEARRLQESAGYTPKVVVMVNTGINDRNETGSPSLGPGGFVDADSPEAYVDNFRALVARVESVWNANFSDGEIYWMVIPSHPISNPDDAELITYRTAIEAYAATVRNIDMVNILDLVEFYEISRNGWDDGGGPEHLTELGYENISRIILDESIRKPKALDIIETALVDLHEDGITTNGINVTGLKNSGTGGSTYDLDVVLGTNDLTVDSYNGIPTIRGGGNSGLSTLVGIEMPQPLTIFCVYQIETLGQRYVFDRNVTGGRIVHFTGGADNVRLNAGVSVDFVTTNLNPRVMGAVCNGASGRYEIYHIGDINPAGAGGNSLNYIHLFCEQTGVAFFPLWIGRLMIIPGALSTDDFDEVSAYLREKWNI